MSLSTPSLFALLCQIPGGAPPKDRPKRARVALRFDSRHAGDIKRNSRDTKWALREPSDIGRIGMLGQSGNCCGSSNRPVSASLVILHRSRHEAGLPPEIMKNDSGQGSRLGPFSYFT